MKVLFLGPPCFDVIDYLLDYGDDVVNTHLPISIETELLKSIEFIISFRYRHIINNDVIKIFNKRAINMHISLLPWNRGADPNLWSFLENTPKGVTIHYIDYGIDTGDIIAQKQVSFSVDDTLRTSYEKLLKSIKDLFKHVWPNIRSGNVEAFPQPKGGSYHQIKDRVAFEHLLTKGWDTPVINLIGKALSGGKL